jgi:hypothetical protein
MKSLRQVIGLAIGLGYTVSCSGIHSSDHLSFGEKLIMDLPLFVLTMVLVGLIWPRDKQDV